MWSVNDGLTGNLLETSGNLHIFSIHSSSRHEKLCQMLQRLFWLFQCSKTPLCNVTFWQKLIFQLVTRIRTRTRDNMVLNHLNDFLGQNCQCGRGRERRTSDWERWAAAWYKGLFYHHPTTCNSRCFFENSLGEHEGRTFRSVGIGCALAPPGSPSAFKILQK